MSGGKQFLEVPFSKYWKMPFIQHQYHACIVLVLN